MILYLFASVGILTCLVLMVGLLVLGWILVCDAQCRLTLRDQDRRGRTPLPQFHRRTRTNPMARRIDEGLRYGREVMLLIWRQSGR